MLNLRLTQSSAGQDEYRVEIALEGDGLPRQTAVARFPFALSPRAEENVRWYLEDYLEHPFDPAPTIAASEAPVRWGIVRRLVSVTSSSCATQLRKRVTCQVLLSASTMLNRMARTAGRMPLATPSRTTRRTPNMRSLVGK